MPEPLSDLDSREIRFTKVIAKENIKDEVLEYTGKDNADNFGKTK